jgi:hypothetical protein
LPSGSLSSRAHALDTERVGGSRRCRGQRRERRVVAVIERDRGDVERTLAQLEADQATEQPILAAEILGDARDRDGIAPRGSRLASRLLVDGAREHELAGAERAHRGLRRTCDRDDAAARVGPDRLGQPRNLRAANDGAQVVRHLAPARWRLDERPRDIDSVRRGALDRRDGSGVRIVLLRSRRVGRSHVVTTMGPQRRHCHTDDHHEDDELSHADRT